MPIETAIWRIDGGLQKVEMTALDGEIRLEEALAKDLSMVAPGLLLLGRQVATEQGNRIDLLAMDAEGSLVVIELKKGRTPRDVMAQVLDYASWVRQLSHEKVASIYAEKNGGMKLEAAFAEAFDESLPEELNEDHRLVVVCSDLDPSTERIITYLNDSYGVPINVVFFRHYQDGGHQYLTRTWLIAPDEAEAKASKASGKKSAEPWNGKDYFVNIGEGDHRTWEDCAKYGFVSAGQGKWYSQTLSNLHPGHRVFVHVPGHGYVGVGVVVDPVVRVDEFMVDVGGKKASILKAPVKAPKMDDNVSDPEKAEYLVRVKWLKAVPREQAYWEKGLFAKQHSACKLRNKFTIEKVTQHFRLTE